MNPANPAISEPVLSVRDLRVDFRTGGGAAVRGLSFDLGRGEVLGIVGESGAGKSAAALALMGLHDPLRTHVTGSVTLAGEELLGRGDAHWRRIRGRRISMVFQDALAALSPYHQVRDQLEEAYLLHNAGATRRDARARAVEMLERVGIADAAARARHYPHQFSGGMRQRVMIAMALMNQPDVVLADEPTTALDVTVQAQVLDLLARLRRELGLSVVLITHDIGVVAELADRALVMRHGVLVEEGPTAQLLHDAAEPYTRMLVAAVPTLDSPIPTVTVRAEPRPSALSATATDPGRGPGDGPGDGPRPLLAVRDLGVVFPLRSAVLRRRTGQVDAVRDVTFEIGPGESFGLVGESGSGKTTTARVVVGLTEPTTGRVLVDGRDVTDLTQRGRLRRDVQIVFQDPYSALNPRRTVEQILTAPLRVHTDLDTDARRGLAVEMLERVGLSRGQLRRYPHEFSGGQRQRIGIARALMLRPRLIVADEAVSALDVSIRAQVLDLLRELRADLGVAYLFVSHDLAVVRLFCDRIAVMHRGSIVETGGRELFDAPRHPYTSALLAAVPRFSARTPTPDRNGAQ